MANERRGLVGRPKGKGSEFVRQTLRERILTSDILPDTVLDEVALAREFKVSRTPLREALIRLASEGYIELQPNRAPRVTPLPVSGLSPCYEALELSGRILARWAAARRTEEHLAEMEKHNAACKAAFADEDYLRLSEANQKFHMAIGKAAANEYFAKLFEEAHATSQRYANAIIFPDPFQKPWEHKQYKSVVREHAQMIEAIRAGDETAAEQLTQKHIRTFRDRVIEHFFEDKRAKPIMLEYNLATSEAR